MIFISIASIFPIQAAFSRREVIGERVRDKIPAGKRKGLCVGGPAPLGYAVKDMVLAVVPDQAESVRTSRNRPALSPAASAN
jgi:DNA invertase Pin-like site-specific DNA recombinase